MVFDSLNGTIEHFVPRSNTFILENYTYNNSYDRVIKLFEQFLFFFITEFERDKLSNSFDCNNSVVPIANFNII